MLNTVTFENQEMDGRTCWSDIVRDGIVLGALAETERGVLQPILTKAQICVPEKYAGLGDGWYESEDDGYIFLYWMELEGVDKLIDFYDNVLDNNDKLKIQTP